MLKANVVEGQICRARKMDAFVGIVAACLLLSTSMSATAFATTYYVDYDGLDNVLGTGDDGRDVNPGTSPEAPFQTIQKGIDVASRGDTVMVMPIGVGAQIPYVENLVVNGKKNLKIIGPWDPTPPPFPAPELDYGRWCKGQHVDGNAAGPVLRIVNSKGIFVENLVFTNGKADYGAGIQIQDSAEISLEDCCILENETVHDGGGIWAHKVKKLNIRQCWVYRNKVTEHEDGGIAAPVKGGGIYLQECEKVLVEESRIEENKAAFAGGGVFLTRTDLDMKRSCVFRNGIVVAGGMTDGGYGGGLALRGTSKFSADTELKSSNNVYKGNSVRPGNGGGIACYGLSEVTRVIAAEWGQTDVVSKEDTFIGNKTLENPGISGSKCRGGAFMMKGIRSEATFQKARFKMNYAHEDGGAAYFVGASKGTFEACEFIRNIAKDDGGAIEVTGYARISVGNSKFLPVENGGSSEDLGNEAMTNGGGGIHVTTRAQCELTGENIFKRCKAPFGGAIHNRNALLYVFGRAQFENNRAVGDGGGIYAWATKDTEAPGQEPSPNGPTVVTLLGRHIFMRNKAGGRGGAIAVYGRGQPFVTEHRLALHVESPAEAVTIMENAAGTPHFGAVHAGLWVYQDYNRANTTIRIRRTQFAGHTVAYQDTDPSLPITACAVIGGDVGDVTHVACGIERCFLSHNQIALFLRKCQASLNRLQIGRNWQIGIEARGVKGRLRRTIVHMSDVLDINAIEGTALDIQNCDFDGRSAFPRGLQISADSHMTQIRFSNIRRHTDFGVNFPWVSGGTRVFAQRNFWGSPNGPRDPSNADGLVNPNGTGDFVSDGVDYRFFRPYPYTVEPRWSQ